MSKPSYVVHFYKEERSSYYGCTKTFGNKERAIGYCLAKQGKVYLASSKKEADEMQKECDSQSYWEDKVPVWGR